jgi:aspartate dehydrogenase
MKGLKKIGIVGCGTIGNYLARFVHARIPRGKARLAYVFDRDREKSAMLARSLQGVRQAKNLSALLRESDIIIEAASPEALVDIALQLKRSKKELLSLSVGGFLRNPRLLKDLRRSAATTFIPTGAIAGIDAILAASLEGIDYVSLTTKKSGNSLQDAPYIKKKKLSLGDLKDEKVVFIGSPEEATKGFPQNINVAATLYLASLAKKMVVKIVASPFVRANIHEIEAHGSFGRIFTRVENTTFTDNPKTSKLAAFSAARLLLKKFEPIQVGT